VNTDVALGEERATRISALRRPAVLVVKGVLSLDGCKIIALSGAGVVAEESAKVEASRLSIEGCAAQAILVASGSLLALSGSKIAGSV